MERVFLFEEGGISIKERGGKGNSLAEMSQQGFPIPPGFTITTSTCIDFLDNNNRYPEGLWEKILEKLAQVELKTKKKFGDPSNPLLISVRSGAAVSMPGMLDTILNIGLNQEIVDGFSKLTGNPRFVKDAYRRLIQMFGDVVHGLPNQPFEAALEKIKKKSGIDEDRHLSESNLDELITEFLKIYRRIHGDVFPSDPLEQLDQAIKAVFLSWNNKRAINYRIHERIPHDVGTAVSIQSMVFGNYDDESGTGVLFTRNPANGNNIIFGEFLVNAQGEDVVAGIRTPLPIKELESKFPEIAKNLYEMAENLEAHYKDMQDVEFTVERGILYILQTRAGKRTGLAAAKIAVDQVNSGMISKNEAILRLMPRDIEESLFPSVLWSDERWLEYYKINNVSEKLFGKTVDEITKDAKIAKAKIIGEGLPAGPGAASGHIIFSSDLAKKIVDGKQEAPFPVKKWRKFGDRKVPRLILVKKETSPEDFHGMVASVGILTMRGGMTSHAALVGRQIGKRVIVGGSSSGLELRSDNFKTKEDVTYKQGDVISMEIYDKGLVFDGYLPIVTPQKLPDEVEEILDWADKVAKIKVRTNADKKNDTQMAIDFKATGTGLARTEHQFFDELETMRDMILADTKEQRQRAVDEMVNFQREDFKDLFTVTNGRPVTIRLLDPPLHEFLPNELELREKIWREHLHPDSQEAHVLRKVLFYQEANPMLGLRGCRLGLIFPEITVMQTRAILEAALEIKSKGIEVHPEIMVPLVGFNEEFVQTRKIIDETAEKIFEENGDRIDYLVGTMIEIPRAALTASEIAGGIKGADFFSFGTNDLHQMTLGFSRDDVAKFLPFYLENNIINSDPFQTIETTGVGRLMDMCVQDGRKAARETAGKYLSVGCCGEHAGNLESIEFCYKIGLDYVSCSPFRVPVARLAAGQATLKYPTPDAKYEKIYPKPGNIWLDHQNHN